MQTQEEIVSMPTGGLICDVNTGHTVKDLKVPLHQKV